jgi:pyruvate dehydrogenase E2 component (dihydrolipoyllysine-residue acetyltransferase)
MESFVSDFTLPELGENVSAGDVLRVLVKPGDTLAMDQPVLELETDKATIEVPSSVAGTVGEIKVKPGDKVKVGEVILTVKDGGKAEGQKAGGQESKADGLKSKAEGLAGRKAAPQPSTPQPDEDEDVEEAGGGAVGANTAAKVPDDEAGLEQHVEGERRDSGDKAGTKRDTREAAADAEPARQKVVDISRGARPAAEAATPEMPPAPAAPSVRRLARELGVDINQVPGSGPSGRISVDDVKAHAKRLLASSARGAGAAVQLPDFSRWGETERQPMRAVRRKTAEHLSAAWQTIPHVTQCDLADITSLEELRRKYAKQVEAGGGNLTVTAIAVKVVAAALRVFPQFNASIDLGADEIVLKKYVNIGVAVDTDRGLLVPVIRNADQKNIVQLAAELAQLSEKARTRKIALEEMQGGCFSISNLGGIGGTYFTPIVNAPEVAILGISRARMEPVYQKDSGEFAGRMMLPLSLSYDHRVIDGADGIRFLRWVAEALEQPFLLSLHG